MSPRGPGHPSGESLIHVYMYRFYGNNCHNCTNLLYVPNIYPQADLLVDLRYYCSGMWISTSQIDNTHPDHPQLSILQLIGAGAQGYRVS